MAGTLTHVFVSTHTENNSSGGISANEWNSSHALSGTWDSSQITSVTAGQITGSILGSQIATIGSSQLSTQVLSSQIASLGSSQLTGTVLSSQIATITSSQISTQLLSSQLASLASSQVTVSASNLAFTSSYIQTIGSSQVTGTLPSSQGGTGATTLGANGNLFYNNSSVVTAISGSSFNGSNQLTLTSMNVFINGEIVNTAIDLQIHRGLGGL